MESAVELAMETSRVKSVVRNQAEAKLNQLEHDEPAETMTTSCNDAIEEVFVRLSERRDVGEFVQLRDDVGATTYCVSHTAAAVVHLWSLGVLTAAGCGIGSVHAVVRSNLLVEPSEVEEGETQSHSCGSCALSLGVLTTAGCGIGSVHAVVRSNLLVEPSEVE
ncbi:hypothetical protein F511_28946 [Dorcoceras hygrometricum]|uniref:Uncharacterized protein n=1 Tax=Dorcoceras hygrometricum TaxID=472368 RepID=A0A2Z7AWR3_9LAMI|nr:hypothetical protein F511_28946 [Dorcoceras hygrometricum]